MTALYYTRDDLIRAARGEGYLLCEQSRPRRLKEGENVHVVELVVERDEGIPYYVTSGYMFTVRVVASNKEFAALRLMKEDVDFLKKG